MSSKWISSGSMLAALLAIGSVVYPQGSLSTAKASGLAERGNWGATSVRVLHSPILETEVLGAAATSTDRTSWLTVVTVQDPAPGSAPQEPMEARPKPRRLPTYYSRVVTQKQRDEIYAIQDRFETELEALRKQIEEKTLARDKEIEGVLNPEQLAEVQRLNEEAKARRIERAGAGAESSDGTSPMPDDGSGNLPPRA